MAAPVLVATVTGSDARSSISKEYGGRGADAAAARADPVYNAIGQVSCSERTRDQMLMLQLKFSLAGRRSTSKVDGHSKGGKDIGAHKKIFNGYSSTNAMLLMRSVDKGHVHCCEVPPLQLAASIAHLNALCRSSQSVGGPSEKRPRHRPHLLRMQLYASMICWT